MRRSFGASVRSIDWVLITSIVFLSIISMIVVYGISMNRQPADPFLFRKHAAFVILGIVTYVLFSITNYRMWTSYSKVAYLIGLLLLVTVLFIGIPIRGTRGWFPLGFTTFQPVEVAKIALLLLLAKYFSDHARLFFLWRHTIASGALVVLYVGLILRQPDLGSAIVIMGSWFLMLIVAGIPRKQLVTILALFAVTAVMAWSFVLKDYQKQRVITFINPQVDVQGVGYNVRQSIIAVGSGRVLGRGFGLGSQSQLKFLPEPETDFIFAVVSEEFGFLGVTLVFLGIGTILFRLLSIARTTDDNFAAYFCLGLASLLTVQTFINIGMNVGIAPVTGIPLPFVSVGGSSFVALCAACGIASSIVADQRTLRSGLNT